MPCNFPVHVACGVAALGIGPSCLCCSLPGFPLGQHSGPTKLQTRQDFGQA